MKKIFISYRRAEAEYAAGALARDLREHFGEEQVFRDKEDIGGGVAWKQEIVNEINAEAAMLVLIGKEWLGAKNSQGERRLVVADDPIRMEIAGGLARGARVIPVLLENAVMPNDADLPPDLRGLTQYNALQLRDSDWQYDLSKILKTLGKVGFVSALQAAPAAATTSTDALAPAATIERRRGKPVKLIVSYVLSALAFIGYEKTHDQDTFYGLAVFGFIALVLAILAYRDYRQGRAGGQWGPIGAIALSGFITLGYVGLGNEAPEKAPQPTGAAPSAEQPAAATPAGTKLAEPVPTPAPATKNAPVANVANAVNQAARPNKATPGFAGMQPLAQDPGGKLPGQAQVPNVSGRWRDSDDNTAIMFSQQGGNVHMVATQQGVAVEGLGTMSGRQLHIALTLAGIPFSEMRLTLSPDGRALQGSMITQGQQEPVHFVR